jgi:hypothetical protein
MSEAKQESPALAQPLSVARAKALGANFANSAAHGDAIEVAGVTLRAVCRTHAIAPHAVLVEAQISTKAYPMGSEGLRRLAAALLGIADVMDVSIPAPPPNIAAAAQRRAAYLGAEESAA